MVFARTFRPDSFPERDPRSEPLLLRHRTCLPVGNDDFGQPGALFRLMSLDQKRQLFDNITAAMKGCRRRSSCARTGIS